MPVKIKYDFIFRVSLVQNYYKLDLWFLLSVACKPMAKGCGAIFAANFTFANQNFEYSKSVVNSHFLEREKTFVYTQFYKDLIIFDFCTSSCKYFLINFIIYKSGVFY